MKKILLLLTFVASVSATSQWKMWNYHEVTNYFSYIDKQNQKWHGNTYGGLHDFVIVSDTVDQHFDFLSNAPKAMSNVISTNFLNDTLFTAVSRDSPQALITFNPKTKTYTYNYYPDSMPTVKMFGVTVKVAPDGSFWIGTNGDGIIHYADGQWTHYDSTNSTLKMNQSGDQYFDNAGNVWISWPTYYGRDVGVSIFDGKNWTLLDSSTYHIPVSLNVRDMEFLPDGTAWMAIYTDFNDTNGGAIRFKDGTMTYYDPRTEWGAKYNGVVNISVGKDGTIKLNDRGYTKDNGETWGNFLTDSMIVEDPNNFNYFCRQDTVNGTSWWIRSAGGPAYFWDNGVITLFDTLAYGKQMKNVKYIATGPDSTAWFRWYDYPNGSLLSFKNGVFTWHTFFTVSLSNDTTTALTVSPSNTRYIATNYGISRNDDSGWNAWPNGQIGISPITSLYADKQGNLWAGSNSGTSSEGLAKFDGSSWSLITTANSNLPSPEIYDICEGMGKLWISHREGISSYDGTTFTNYTRGKEFPVSVSMGGITFDKSGNLWAATSNGACKFDGTNWTTFDSSNSSMPVNYLFDVAVDTAGDLWFGSLKSGLVKYDGSNWSTIDSANGAPSNDIRKVVTDSFGKLWMPTDKGVYRFDGSSWNVYDSANSDIQDNRISSIAIAPDGSKWFGTKYNGIAQLIDDDIVGTVVKPAFKTVSPKLTVVGNEIRFSGTGAASLTLFDLRGRVVFSQNWAGLNGSARVVPTVGKGVYVARLNVNGLVVGMKIKL